MKNNSCSPQNAFDLLPSELFYQICEYLRTEDLIALAIVDRERNNLIRADEIWSKNLKNEYGFFPLVKQSSLQNFNIKELNKILYRCKQINLKSNTKEIEQQFFQKNLSMIKQYADENVTWAHLLLASAYLYGYGVDKNLNEAVKPLEFLIDKFDEIERASLQKPMTLMIVKFNRLALSDKNISSEITSMFAEFLEKNQRLYAESTTPSYK